MTNKPMLSVELRALLERLLSHDFAEECQECGIGYSDAWGELRALLDRPAAIGSGDEDLVPFMRPALRDPVVGNCTHPPGCKSCSWCGFKDDPTPAIKLHLNVSNVKVTINADGSYTIDPVEQPRLQGEPVAYVDDRLHIQTIYGKDGALIKRGDKLYLQLQNVQVKPYGYMFHPEGKKNEEFFMYEVPDKRGPDVDGEYWTATALYTEQPAPVAVVMPEDWEDQLFAEMSRRFDLRKQIDDDHMVYDDTQIGVEFARDWIKSRLNEVKP